MEINNFLNSIIDCPTGNSPWHVQSERYVPKFHAVTLLLIVEKSRFPKVKQGPKWEKVHEVTKI